MASELQKAIGTGGTVRRIRYLPMETTMPDGRVGGLVLASSPVDAQGGFLGRAA
jgi:hypothetical protein